MASLTHLQTLVTSDPVVCCILYNLYTKSKADCLAPEDELSSCLDLIGSNFVRAFLWLLSLRAILGNGSVITYRLFFEKKTSTRGFHIFVTSLGVSDFLMGVYLTAIGSADVYYTGQFMWQRWQWKRHVVCTLAGVLATVSSEVSACTICLIMLDRLLVVQCPLHKHLHFSTHTSLTTVALTWMIGFAIALIPIFNKHWDFYQQNAICVPLPITRLDFPGHYYAQSVFLVLNLSIFLIIGVGQMLIYRAVRSSSKATIQRSATMDDVAIARRLFLVVFSDFCC